MWSKYHMTEQNIQIAMALYINSLVPSRCILIFLSFFILSPMKGDFVLCFVLQRYEKK